MRLIALGGLGVAPLVLLAVRYLFFDYREERQRALTGVLDIARAPAPTVDGRFEARIAILGGLASANSLRDARFGDFFVRATHVLRSLPVGSVITVSAADGQQMVNTSVAPGIPCRGTPVVAPTRRGFGSILIERMPQELGGSVDLRFDPAGVSCSIVMPVAEVAAEGSVLPTRPTTAMAGEADLSGRPILLVEDSILVAMESAQALEDEGCLVETASDLATALTLARDADLDAAVLDVNLSGEMVFPAAYALRERRIPFLFLTGYDDPRLWPEELLAALRALPL